MNKKIMFYVSILIILILSLAACNSIPATLKGDAQQGGLLYDKWWKTLDIDAPEGEQPLWAFQETNIRTGDSTMRCKECHGWDYLGEEGAYASGSHFTGFIGVFQLSDGDSATILAALNGEANPDHDFSIYMSEDELIDLATFIQSGLIDMSLYINEDKSINGDPTEGQPLYESVCATCHGDDGSLMNFGDETDPEYLGDLAAGNPWEVIHKVANGQPGTDMPSTLNEGWSLQSIADVVAYLQTLANE
jgi:thiosulfate dehydrogenase